MINMFSINVLQFKKVQPVLRTMPCPFHAFLGRLACLTSIALFRADRLLGRTLPATRPLALRRAHSASTELCRLRNGLACWTKFFKLVWIIFYSIQKELCKNIQLFSFNSFLTNYGRGTAKPLYTLGD